jgi:hypothetical protein
VYQDLVPGKRADFSLFHNAHILRGPLSLSSVGTYKLLSVTPGKKDTKVNVHIVRSGLMNLVCGAGNFNRFLSECRQYEVQYRE